MAKCGAGVSIPCSRDVIIKQNDGGESMVKKMFGMFILMLTVFIAGTAMASVSVSWTTQPGDVCIGTCVAPQGQAGATGFIGGSGLDLVIVMDSSGSMTTVVSGKSRQAWQKEAAIALVNGLPVGTTAVGIVEFDSDANTLRMLSQLTTDKATVIAAINTVDASGGTTIGAGIDRATSELTGALHTVGRLQSMVVMSDGETSGSPATNALNAIAAGVDSIHTVGLPGHSATTMRGIVDGPDNIYGNADDYGTYTNVSSDISALINIFNGTGGNLVGLDHVDITLPNGNFIANYPTDAFGNFVIDPCWTMTAGANTFIATAYDTAGSSATATLTLNGINCNQVPEPGTLLLLLCGLPGLAIMRRRFSK